MKENYQKTNDYDPITELSSEPSENTLIHNIELSEDNTYFNEKAFIFVIRTYAKQQGFQVHLGKSEKNAAGQI